VRALGVIGAPLHKLQSGDVCDYLLGMSAAWPRWVRCWCWRPAP